MQFRELAQDLGWLTLIVLLLPLVIPFGALAALFLLGERLYWGNRRRMRRAGVTG